MSVHCCLSLFSMFLCEGHCVFVSLFACLPICASAPAQLFIFLSDKDEKYDDAVFFVLFFFLTQVHTNAILVFHLLRSLPLLVVSMVCNTAPFSHFPQVLVCFGLTGHYADAAL